MKKDVDRSELTASAIASGHLLYNTKQACEVLGGITGERLAELAGSHAIRIGKKNYYRPEDLVEVRDSLVYGRQS
ncbi:hypothetical protein CRD60_01040 [Bifidobacterium aemilianum]|uniref:DNA-binding protein n=1 Tax=Bifidobacterium aemilianum TaxID=2493120 RepID=A0A366KB62_9BIFI|nr:hypothetical protein [Bifidobacterium aemilianum]RBP98482.1 hypothetical protein CRD60_01040 [Bifidobacterium aemilianum]